MNQVPRTTPPTQKEVAKLAGVSQAAVSRWTSGRGYVAAEVRERIEKAVDALGYAPHPLAQGLSSGQSEIVAIVMANITNPWYPLVLERITQVLQAANKQVLLFNATPPQSVDDVVPDVLRYRVRGVIVTTASLTSTAAQQFTEQGVPVVLFNRTTRTGGAHAVSCDNADGGRMAADALMRSGARHVAFVGGTPDSSTNADRLRGFRQQLAEWGQAPVEEVGREYTYAWGFEAVLEVMARHPEIDGLFCADDEIASGAIDALRYRLGKRVPQDVRVMGFDDHPIASTQAYQITTFRQPVEEMIQQAVSLLLDSDVVEPSTRLIKGQFIARGSA
jgi:DNA-binding LacI/PurR family transcriptional regulator